MVDVAALKDPVWDACKTCGLECTRFCCGMFMNYLAFGSGKTELLQGLVDKPIVGDIERRKAELPQCDNGHYPKITMTELSDIGSFLAAAGELPLGSWRDASSMEGDPISVGEVLRILGFNVRCR